MEYTEVELAVADKLGLEPELVKKVLDTFETEFDRLEQEQYDQWMADKTTRNPNGLTFTDMVYKGVVFDD